MFDRITLGVNGDTNLIQTRLYNHPECVFPISIFKDENKEAITYIEFNPSQDVFVLDQYVNVVAEYIIDRYETRLLRRILEESYKDLSVVQKREILKSIEHRSDDPVYGYHARKQAIILSIYDYLKEDTTMLLDGFVSFRLKEYESLLKKLAQGLVEQYAAQKEYEEFVRLLQYFVNLQQPRPAMIHVLVCTDEGYVIMDEKGTDITAPCFSDFVEDEVLLTKEAYDDLLISVLITLAPQQITVHNRSAIQNHELFSTISQVFNGKITYCNGCTLCTE
ncbi:MAG: hypothetical protein E7393_03325 [Ruminococcaceae bacterium]|nr:hypothetical protein [Oscillospiraceae bacterium]